MTRDPLTQLSTRTTPQTERADVRQTRNNAGGFTFRVTPWTRLDRFLTLGVDGGSYYVEARPLALDNLVNVRDLIALEPIEVVRRIVEISESGRAPRQQPGLFTLAAVYGLANVEGRRAAEHALPRVARTGSTLKTFVRYVEQFRGWGPTLRRGVSDWYLNQDVADLAYQAVKYRTRADWSDRDVLRVAHPKPAKDDVYRRELFDWMCGRPNERLGRNSHAGDGDDPLRVVEGFEQLKRAERAPDVARLVGEYRLPWEAIPDRWLNDVTVLGALVDAGMPPTALMRQLPRLTNAGVLTGDRLRVVADRLADAERLRRGRVHPISALLAMSTYASGHSFRGSTTWRPITRVVDALDAAFYAAFDAVEPTDARFLLALDVSSSMTNHRVADTNLSAREVAAAMTLITLRTEANCEVVGFTSGQTGGMYDGYNSVTPLTLSPRQRLDDVVAYTRRLSFGATDCALPMLYALERKLEVDAFVIYTDNETWAGDVHPHEALRRYRNQVNPRARLIAVGATATNYTVADPDDAGQLDVSGFDAEVPNLINNFVRGEI